MNRDKIIYWSTTTIVSMMMLFSAYLYFTSQEMVEAFKHLGYPDFLRVEIGIAKILGALVLLIPQFPTKVKEWAYAGFGIVLISASLSHFLVHDPIARVITPFVFLLILIVSNIYFSKIKNIN